MFSLANIFLSNKNICCASGQKVSQGCPINTWAPECYIPGHSVFLPSVNDIFVDICNITIYVDGTAILSTQSGIKCLMRVNSLSWHLKWFWPSRQSCIGEGSGFLISILEKLNLIDLILQNSGVVSVKMYGSGRDEKLSSKMLELSSASNFD